MKRKILTSFLIVLLTHYFMGCAEYDLVQVREVNQIKAEDRIRSVIIPSGEEVVFNEFHGELVRIPESISGTRRGGGEFKIEADETMKIFGKDNQHLHLAQLRKKPSLFISSIELWSETIEFDDNGGKFEPDGSLVRGITKAGKFFQVPVSQVGVYVLDSYNVIVSILFSTGTLVLGIAVTGGVGFLLYMMAHADY